MLLILFLEFSRLRDLVIASATGYFLKGCLEDGELWLLLCELATPHRIAGVVSEFCCTMSGEPKTDIRKSIWWRIAAANTDEKRRQRRELVRVLQQHKHFI